MKVKEDSFSLGLRETRFFINLEQASGGRAQRKHRPGDQVGLGIGGQQM